MAQDEGHKPRRHFFTSIKNERISHQGKVTGNIKGYEEPVLVTYHTPTYINQTSQYIARKAKFMKWLELSEIKLVE
jgi:hypothetical protein